MTLATLVEEEGINYFPLDGMEPQPWQWTAAVAFDELKGINVRQIVAR